MTGWDIALFVVGIALGGFLKGATGAGTPVVGVPILAIAFGVPKAVAIFSLLNLFSNLWQGWAYRADLRPGRFVWSFALAGALGAGLGSLLLASLSTDPDGRSGLRGLSLYRFATAAPRLADRQAEGEALAAPVGLVGGLMQGAGGISAPVSVTFLNAMRLERSEFIATISVFFLMMSVLQIPSLIALGILTWERAGLAVLGLIPLFGAMPLGERAARHISKQAFDRLILVLLTVVALRLVYTALT